MQLRGRVFPDGVPAGHGKPLSERLPIPPVAERTLDQHLLWLDVRSLEEELARAYAEMERQEEPVYTGAIGMHEFSSEGQARACWDILSFLRSPGVSWPVWKASPQLHRPFPPDVAVQKRQRARLDSQRAFAAKWAAQFKPSPQEKTGEINEHLLL